MKTSKGTFGRLPANWRIYDLPWEELLHWDDSWDAKPRFAPSKAALAYLLMMK
jgi:hypothetical protein